MTEQNSENRQTCTYCKGTGRVDAAGFDGDDIDCPVCQRMGTMYVDPRSIPHDICGGLGHMIGKGSCGKMRMVCFGCQGTGWYVP